MISRRNLTTLALLAVAVLGGMATLRGPQEKPGDARGHFDFWVLALSWSPTYCLQDGDDDDPQCGAEARPGFVVHGLWPQYESGYPANCGLGPERIEWRFAEEMADLMPSPRLVFHQWRKHGRCTGQSPDAYFAATRQAAETVTLPAEFSGGATKRLSPQQIEASLAAANPGLDADEMAVVCHDGLLREIRVCMGTDFTYRACPEVDANACRASVIALPSARRTR